MQGWTTVGGQAGRGRAASARPTATTSTRWSASSASATRTLTHDVTSWMTRAAEDRSTPSTGSTPTTATPATSSADSTRSARATSTRPCRRGARARREWRGYLSDGPAPARDQPGAGLLRQLEQQAGTGLRDRRRVRLQPDLPLGAARPAAEEAARRAPPRPGPLRRRQGDGDRSQPGPRRSGAERPDPEVRRQPLRARRREGDAGAAEVVERQGFAPAQGPAQRHAVRRPRRGRHLRRAGPEPDPGLLRPDPRCRRQRWRRVDRWRHAAGVRRSCRCSG